MIIDRENRFSNNQTISTGSDSGNGTRSTDVIDLGKARDIGAGENVYLVVQVKTALDMSGSETLTVRLITDDNDGLNSATTVQTIGTFPANAAAGSVLIARLQPSDNYERYLGTFYISSNAALTGGGVTAFLTTDVDRFKAYANAFDIKAES